MTGHPVLYNFRISRGRKVKKTKPVYPIVSCRGRVCLPEDTKQTVFGRADLAPTNQKTALSTFFDTTPYNILQSNEGIVILNDHKLSPTLHLYR